MTKYYYKNTHSNRLRTGIRYSGLGMAVLGFFSLLYFFFPLLSWQLYLAPAFAAEKLALPIPKSTVTNGNEIQSLMQTNSSVLSGVDYNNVQNWFPTFKPSNVVATVQQYSLSIPILGIANAEVTTHDNDLSRHLVNYIGTSVPPAKGNAVIFGHSTLPQLYDPHNYKTIFAYAHTLKTGEIITVTVSGVTYTYKIYSISIIDPGDTSVLSQAYDDSYLTIVTCTPPGTVWKRLVIKSRLQKI